MYTCLPHGLFMTNRHTLPVYLKILTFCQYDSVLQKKTLIIEAWCMLIPCAKSSPIPADANLPHQYCSLLLIYFNTIAAELVIKSMYIDVAPPCIVPDLNLYL